MRVAGWTGLLLLILLPGGPAAAYEYHHCMGHATRWASNPQLEIDACTVTGEQLSAVRNMLWSWNDIGGTDLQIRHVERGRCGARVGDGQNTITIVPAAAIDGALGLTMRRYAGFCGGPLAFMASDRIIEADVLIRRFSGHEEPPSNCPAGNPIAQLWTRRPCCEAWSGTTFRATVLHELGHFLGLNHEDDTLAVMMSTQGEARYCAERPWGPMPDDIAGVRRLYGRNRDAIRELSAVSQRHIGPDLLFGVGQRPTDRALGRMPPGLAAPLRAESLPQPDELDREGCPGQLVPVQYAVANRGTLTGRYRVLWWASADRHLSPDDVLLGTTPWRGISRELISTAYDTVPISQRLPPDRAHRLLYSIEPAWGWGVERRTGDQIGVLPGTLTRLSPDACR